MSKSDITFIYALIDPRNDDVRYVGQSYRPMRRLEQHATQLEHNREKAVWVADLTALDLAPRMRLLEAVTFACGNAAEAYWIHFYSDAGADLVNLQIPERTAYTPRAVETAPDICSGVEGRTARTEKEHVRRVADHKMYRDRVSCLEIVKASRNLLQYGISDYEALALPDLHDDDAAEYIRTALARNGAEPTEIAEIINNFELSLPPHKCSRTDSAMY